MAIPPWHFWVRSSFLAEARTIAWSARSFHETDPHWPIFFNTIPLVTIASNPVVVNFTSNSGQPKLAVFAKATAGNLLQWTCATNGDCQGPFDKQGILYGTPTAVVDAANAQNIRVFGRGTDNRVYRLNCGGTDAELNCDAWTPLNNQTITG
ncbi:MAG TPA: hypothetical protein VGF45_07330 [Polyangia bacterium]